MSGLCRATGAALDGLDHLRQSIADILTTPIGSRVMRRDYGSLLPELIDHPDNGATRVRLMSATAGALMRWEPRLRISRVSLSAANAAGQVLLEIEGTHVPRGGLRQALDLRVPLQLRAAA